MARYYPVSPLYWSDSKVQSWPTETKMLGLYLLTCEHRNLEGLYRLPFAYIEADLGWTREDVIDRMADLIETGFINYDREAQVVFLPKALKYHTPKSGKQIQGALNALQEVPDTTLWPQFVEAARTFATALYAVLEPAGTNPSETHSEGLSNGYPATEV